MHDQTGNCSRVDRNQDAWNHKLPTKVHCVKKRVTKGSMLHASKVLTDQRSVSPHAIFEPSLG